MSWLRLRQIALVAHELAPVVEKLEQVFGLEVCHRDPGVATFGLENALLPIGNQILEVVAPTQENTAAGRYLEARGGDGGYMVITHTDDHPRRKQRATELGIRIVWGNESETYTGMQLHPKDTGGSFLEIDYQPGGEDPEGPWWPAGPNWQRARRTDVIDAIRVAEIQADAPERLARRWSEIVELPVESRQGNPEIALDNARLRFVPCSDGRPEGLGGIDVGAVDRDGALERAAALGLATKGDTIELCGTRFKLCGDA